MAQLQYTDINDMNDRQKILNEFLEKIYRIAIDLGELDKLAYEIPQLYSTDKFSEQKKLLANMEDLIIAATHETASQIGFYKYDIENLAKFIEFREKYFEFSDNELTEILDGNLSMEIKRNLSRRFDSAESMITRLDKLKQDWNETFDNKDYAKLKKQIRI